MTNLQAPNALTPSPVRQCYRTIVVILLVCLFASVVIFACVFVSNKLWQRRDVDIAWAERTAKAAEPIIEVLEEFRLANGAYPDELSELVPGQLPGIPSIPPHPSSGGEKWEYEVRDTGEYELSVTCMHWVSSYDTLIYRPTHDYADVHAAAERWRLCPIGDWMYVIGGSSLE